MVAVRSARSNGYSAYRTGVTLGITDRQWGLVSSNLLWTSALLFTVSRSLAEILDVCNIIIHWICQCPNLRCRMNVGILAQTEYIYRTLS